MKVPETLYRSAVTDADTQAFFQLFDEPPDGTVLEVGAHDEPVANVLTDCGFRVTGVDLRQYHAGQDVPGATSPLCNYTYYRHDFCNLPHDLYREFLGKFDCIVSLSAIEHFGLGTYGEGAPHTYYDVVAMRLMWAFLKEGGTAYVTVPFGRDFIEVAPHWRIYDGLSVRRRLVQDFAVEFAAPFVAGPLLLDGQKLDWGDPITMEEAVSYSGEEPHVSIILKLRKVPVKRLAPDGR